MSASHWRQHVRRRYTMVGDLGDPVDSGARAAGSRAWLRSAARGGAGERARGRSRIVLVGLAASLAALAAAAVPASAATLRATTTEDAYVERANPTRNFGRSTSLLTDYDNRLENARSYLKFSVPASDPVVSAKLRVYGTNPGHGPAAYSVPSLAWKEGTVTWRRRAGLGKRLTAGPAWVAAGGYAEWDVTAAVKRRGSYAFALVPDAKDQNGVLYKSRQASRGPKPQLVVTTRTTTRPPPPAPTPPPPPSDAGARPYDPASPWNTPVGNAPVHASSASFMRAISDNGLPLTSDVDQYTIPVYHFNSKTPPKTIKFSGYFSSYDAGDSSRKGHGYAPTVSGIPVPDSVQPPPGSDGQVAFVDAERGIEYALWQFRRDSSGNITATNGYRYHTGAGYYGRFADGLAGRGAGLPYLAGLVRPQEIAQGRIDHALAFAYDSPSSAFTYPASKSDGGGFGGVGGTDLPEGTRIQLDPSLDEADFDAWGLSPPAKVIARALQTYGMYVVDHAGSSKIYLESRQTAGWGSSIDRNLVSKVPWSAFRVVREPASP